VLFSIFTFFQCFTPYSRSIGIWVSFSAFFSFLTIIQVLQSVFLIFEVFHCPSPFSKSYSVCVSHFTRLSVFSPYSRSYTVEFSFFMYSVCLAIFQVIECLCLIFHVFQFSHHYPGPTVCISHFFMFFTVSFHVFLILQFFQCLSPYSRYYHVSFSFSLLVSFLGIFLFLQCAFLIFHVFSVSCHIPGHKVFVSHFSRFTVFSLYSRSYCVHFSFFNFFSVSRHIPDHIVLMSHFPLFSVFSPESRSYSVYFSFNVFQCFSPYSRSYNVSFSFSSFF
jgi:hypothetical protein